MEFPSVVTDSEIHCTWFCGDRREEGVALESRVQETFAFI